jgi:hypothetical protein
MHSRCNNLLKEYDIYFHSAYKAHVFITKFCNQISIFITEERARHKHIFSIPTHHSHQKTWTFQGHFYLFKDCPLVVLFIKSECLTSHPPSLNSLARVTHPSNYKMNPITLHLGGE